jgi:hypothetical protein
MPHRTVEMTGRTTKMGAKKTNKINRKVKLETPVKAVSYLRSGTSGIHGQRSHQKIVLSVTLIGNLMVCMQVKHKLVANAILVFQNMKSK